MANLKKQYRISHTEEKIVDLLRNSQSEQMPLIDMLTDNEDNGNLIKLFSYFNGYAQFDDYRPNTRWGDNLKVIKRLEYCEYSAILFIRLNRATFFDNYDIKTYSQSPLYLRLYNLIQIGLSKTLDTLVDTKFVSQPVSDSLVEWLNTDDCSIVIEGGLNTGKITLLNALLYELSKSDQDILVLDSLNELQLDFITNNSRIKIISVESLTLESIALLDDTVIISTDLDSCFIEMLNNLGAINKIIGITSSECKLPLGRVLVVKTDNLEGSKKVVYLKETYYE